MQLPIILIGPMCVGKSTIASILSKQLCIPNIPLDYVRGYYYLKAGMSFDNMESIRKSGDFERYVSFMRLYEIASIENVVTDPEFQNSVIHFGAGHSYYETEDLLAQAHNALINIPNIFLLLPSANAENSTVILSTRIRQQEAGEDPAYVESMIAMNKKFIESQSNFVLAKQVVYTEEKSPEAVVEEIISKLV